MFDPDKGFCAAFASQYSKSWLFRIDQASGLHGLILCSDQLLHEGRTLHGRNLPETVLTCINSIPCIVNLKQSNALIEYIANKTRNEICGSSDIIHVLLHHLMVAR